MRNILPNKEIKVFRILWGALASTHFDLDDPDRKVIGGIPSGLVVEALEIRDNRVKIKRPEYGWSKEKARNFLPEEKFGWISIMAQDGVKLLEPIEDGEETTGNTPMLTLDKEQTKTNGNTPMLTVDKERTEAHVSKRQTILLLKSIFMGGHFAKQVAQNLSRIDVMRRVRSPEKRLVRRMILDLDTAHKEYCKRLQLEIHELFYAMELNEQTRLYQERLEAKAISLEKENQEKKRDVAEKFLDDRGKTYESVKEEVDLISTLKQRILDSGGDEAKNSGNIRYCS